MWTQQKVYIDSPRKSLEAQEKKKSSQKFSVISRTQEASFRKFAIIYGKTAYCKEPVKGASTWVFIFPLSISIICISFCHLAAKSPVMGYICRSMLRAALLLPLPPACSGITRQYSLFYPQPSAYLTAPNRTVPHANQTRYSSCPQVHRAVGTVWWYVTAASVKATETSLKSLYSAEGISREKTFLNSL